MNSDYLQYEIVGKLVRNQINKKCQGCANEKAKMLRVNRGISLYFCTYKHMCDYHMKYDLAASIHSTFSLLWLRQIGLPCDIARVISRLLYTVRKRGKKIYQKCDYCGLICDNHDIYCDPCEKKEVYICGDECKTFKNFNYIGSTRDTHSYIF